MLSTRIRPSVVPMVVLVMSLLCPRGVFAAIRTVTDFGDTTPSGAPGQLRFEINAAAAGDTIVIPAGTITLTGAAGENANASGDLDIRFITLTIQGAGPGVTVIDGGGIDRVFDTVAATVTISGMTIRNGNMGAVSIEGAGGGIYNQVGTVTLTNVTVSGNTSGFRGGGIANNNSNDATLTLVNATVSGNTAILSGGGMLGPATLRNTIVANSPSGGNCSGTMTSLGHNLDSGTTCGFNAPSDLSSADPLLGPLQDNGGPTPTHALLPGSPAIDAGDNTGCPPIDQRGFVRPVDGDGNGSALCDIGAYELGPAIATALAASVLPSGRSVQVGMAATVFATILNAGPGTALGCRIAPVPSLPAASAYQTTDSTTNALTGSPNTPVDIPAGGGQSFVFAVTPTAPIAPTDVLLTFACTNTAPAPALVGVSTLFLLASATPVPDPVALAATPTHDGILTLASAGAFAMATVNVGASALLTVTLDTGGASLPLTLSICQTDAGANCLATPASNVTTQIDAGATPTFSIFALGTGPIPFLPGTNRIFVRFTDGGGVTRGATSVAVRTL